MLSKRPSDLLRFVVTLSCCGESGELKNIIYIEGGTNSRMHHLLPERIAFNMTALRYFLPECIAPRTTRGRHTVRVVLDACRVRENS